MRILVTGGAGFIGSHLCERLLVEGNEVICLDNFFTGRKQNIAHLLDNKSFELVRHDVTEPILLEVDQIYNLACPASPVHYQYNPVKTVKTSVMGMINMLGLAKRVKARILQASTSEVYGDPLDPSADRRLLRQRESDRPAQLLRRRQARRRNADDGLHRQNGVDTRIVRIFNTYGERMLENDGRVVSNFIVQALRGEELTIYGDGTQTRSFCYVSDLVDGIIRLMNAEADDIHMPVNIGNPGEFTMNELAERGRQMRPASEIKIKYLPLPQDDPKQRQPNIERAKKLLGLGADGSAGRRLEKDG